MAIRPATEHRKRMRQLVEVQRTVAAGPSGPYFRPRGVAGSVGAISFTDA